MLTITFNEEKVHSSGIVRWLPTLQLKKIYSFLPFYVNRPYSHYASQCHFFASDWSADTRHQQYHRYVTVIQICCQRKILHHGQVMKTANYTVHLHDTCVTHNANVFRAGSIPPSGAFCGSLLAGFLLQSIGRKSTLMISSPLATIGWILIATATRYEIIILGRFITGFCVGLCLPSAQVYVMVAIVLNIVTN